MPTPTQIQKSDIMPIMHQYCDTHCPRIKTSSILEIWEIFLSVQIDANSSGFHNKQLCLMAAVDTELSKRTVEKISTELSAGELALHHVEDDSPAYLHGRYQISLPLPPLPPSPP